MSLSLAQLDRGDSVTSNESGEIIVGLVEKVTFFVDGEIVFILGAAVATILDGTLGSGVVAGDNALCDFALYKAFNLLVKMLDTCFNASEISFLSLSSGNNLSEESIFASLSAASKAFSITEF